MVVSWIVIVVLVIVGVFAIRLNHLKHRFFIIILVLLALFLYTSVNYITVQNDINLKSSTGIFSGIKIYSGWLANGFQNLKTLTGRVIDLDWKSTNATFFEKEPETKTSKAKISRYGR